MYKQTTYLFRTTGNFSKVTFGVINKKEDEISKIEKSQREITSVFLMN